jgi:hypothetical protein
VDEPKIYKILRPVDLPSKNRASSAASKANKSDRRWTRNFRDGITYSDIPAENISEIARHLLAAMKAFEPARVPTGLHTHTHLLPACSNHAIELLRLFAMREPFFLELSRVSIHRSNLLKLGWKSTPITINVQLSFLPSLLVGFNTTNFTRAWDRHCHGINFLTGFMKAEGAAQAIARMRVQPVTGVTTMF